MVVKVSDFENTVHVLVTFRNTVGYPPIVVGRPHSGAVLTNAYKHKYIITQTIRQEMQILYFIFV